MQRTVGICAVALLWLFSGVRSRAEPLVTFYAMGDVPYAPQEEERLPQQVADIPADAEFVVHLGDIKTGSTACVETLYANVAGALRKSRSRVFVIPGDNEWNDCPDPASAWTHWKKHLFQFDRFWKDGQAVNRQASLPENFSFVRNRVLFIGINLVGGRVHDAQEWRRRHAENVKWVSAAATANKGNVVAMVLFGHAAPAVSHADFFAGVLPVAARFEKPVLYLHGDGHVWVKDRPFGDAKNVLRVQVDRGGIAPPVRIQVGSADPTFSFDRRK